MSQFLFTVKNLNIQERWAYTLWSSRLWNQ